eukprot:4771127-Amphidinium_carterae.1
MERTAFERELCSGLAASTHVGSASVLVARAIFKTSCMPAFATGHLALESRSEHLLSCRREC